jgi:hypothetical protein
MKNPETPAGKKIVTLPERLPVNRILTFWQLFWVRFTLALVSEMPKVPPKALSAMSQSPFTGMFHVST